MIEKGRQCFSIEKKLVSNSRSYLQVGGPRWPLGGLSGLEPSAQDGLSLDLLNKYFSSEN